MDRQAVARELIAVAERLTAKNWTPEQRLIDALSSLDTARTHCLMLPRDAKQTTQSAREALKHIEIAAQILGRDTARDLGLPRAV